MLTSIVVEGLRGIRKGTIGDLAPLTVMVGPSGAGKSTVLDALLIGTAGSPGDAVGRVIRRRPELLQGVPWLFERQRRQAMIVVDGDAPLQRTCVLQRAPDARRGSPMSAAAESIVVCEGFHDRAFLRGWLIAQGCLAAIGAPRILDQLLG